MHSHQQCRRVPFYPHPLHHLLFKDILLMVIMTNVRWYIIEVLFCISLRIINVEKKKNYQCWIFFMCLLAICIFFGEMSLYLLPIFYFILFYFILFFFSYKDYLHILEMNPLSVAWFADIFSYSKSCHLVYGVLCCAKAFLFN